MRTARALLLAAMPALLFPTLLSSCSDDEGSTPAELDDAGDATPPSTDDAGGEQPAPVKPAPDPSTPAETDDDTDDGAVPSSPSPGVDASIDSGSPAPAPTSMNDSGAALDSGLDAGGEGSEGDASIDACARACAAAALAGCSDNSQCAAELCSVRDIDPSCNAEADAYLECIGEATGDDFICFEDRPQYVADTCNDPYFEAWLACME